MGTSSLKLNPDSPQQHLELFLTEANQMDTQVTLPNHAVLVLNMQLFNLNQYHHQNRGVQFSPNRSYLFSSVLTTHYLFNLTTTEEREGEK